MTLKSLLDQFGCFVSEPCLNNRSEYYMRRSIEMREVFYEFFDTLDLKENESEVFFHMVQVKYLNKIHHDNPRGFYFASHSVVISSLIYALDISNSENEHGGYVQVAINSVDSICAELTARIVQMFSPYLRAFYSNEIVTVITGLTKFIQAFPKYSDSIPLRRVTQDMHDVGMLRNSFRSARTFHLKYLKSIERPVYNPSAQLIWAKSRPNYRKLLGERLAGIEPEIEGDGLETWDLDKLPLFSCKS